MMTENEPQHGWVQANGLQLHYWEWPGDDPPLLCLHALTFNGRIWNTLAERLAGRRRIIAPDLRGRGLSDKPPAGSYGWDQHASDVAEVMRQLGIGPLILVGHSLGGYVATLVAARERELVRRLVVVDAGLRLEEAAVRAQGAAALTQLSMVFPSQEAYFEYWRQVPFVHWTRPFEQYLLAGIDRRPDGTVVSRTFPGAVEEDLLYYFRPGAAEHFAEEAGRIQAPTVLCWAPVGMLDPQQPLMSRQGMEELTQLIPNARLFPIEGANHYSILLLPDAVDLIIEAIERSSPKSVRIAPTASVRGGTMSAGELSGT